MTASKIIIDCDPGVDDALALAFAHGSPRVGLHGVTTVAGNMPLDVTTGNALRVTDFLGVTGVPVVAGSAAPLLRPPHDAREVHGETGLGGAVLADPRSAARSGHAVRYLIDEAAAAPGEITLVAVGPLTNIALAAATEPRLVSWIKDLVIMGGSAGRGNITPAAEFNIWADPEAAAVVFAAGWTVTMIGLNVTLQARVTGPVSGRLGTLGRLGRELLLPALSLYRTTPETAMDAGGGPAVHDVCAVAQVADPSLFGLRPARVEVETAGRWTSGMTVTDFDAPPAECNAAVATELDVPRFWDVIMDAYERAAAGLPGPA
jgi:purine nucleosidase